MVPEVPRGSQRLQEAPRGSKRLQDAPRDSQRLPDVGRCVYGCRKPCVLNQLFAVSSTNIPPPPSPRGSHPEAPRGCQRFPEAARCLHMGLSDTIVLGPTNSWLELQQIAHAPTRPEAPRGSQRLTEAPRSSQRLPEAARGWSMGVQL